MERFKRHIDYGFWHQDIRLSKLSQILILQRYYNLSDEQVEYQINDRMSFMRFLDLTINHANC